MSGLETATELQLEQVYEYLSRVELSPESLAQPIQPITWVPNWDHESAVPVKDAEALVSGIRALEELSFGGVERAGNDGPWAQVKRGPDDQFLVEFHPHRHDKHSDEIMLFERTTVYSAEIAGHLCFAWVRGQGFPDGIALEPRYVPAGAWLDLPL